MGIGKTTCVFSMPSGRNATPGMWFQYAGTAPDLDQLSALSEAIAVAFDASGYQTDLPAEISLVQVESQLFEVVDVPVSQTYPYGRRNHPTSLAGLATSVPVAGGNAGVHPPPPQVACRVSLQTARAGKSYRGRLYLPPMSETSLDAKGLWTSGVVTAFDGFATDWRDAIQSSAPVELIPSVHGLAVPSDEPIVHVVGRNYAGTQRRRIKLVS